MTVPTSSFFLPDESSLANVVVAKMTTNNRRNFDIVITEDKERERYLIVNLEERKIDTKEFLQEICRIRTSYTVLVYLVYMKMGICLEYRGVEERFVYRSEKNIFILPSVR